MHRFNSLALIAGSCLMFACVQPPARPTFGKPGTKTIEIAPDPVGPLTDDLEGLTTGDPEDPAPTKTDTPKPTQQSPTAQTNPSPLQAPVANTPSKTPAARPAVQQSPRLDEMTFVTTHNAFVNSKDASWLLPNQSLSLQTQLDRGVTAFMLDIYSNGGKAIMCHGTCNGFPGIGVKMDFVAYLKTIGSYLEKNREAIITVFLEDYATPDELKAAFDQAPEFRDRIFNPYQYDVQNKGWPRLDKMRADNKRLLVISDHRDKQDLGVGFAKDFTAENYWSTGKTGSDLSCRTRWDEAPLNRHSDKMEYLFVMNHFRDIPASAASRDDNQKDKLWSRINKECLPAAERKINYLAVDHFDEGDWGAVKTVEELNEVAAILYKDSNWQGGIQMLKPGRYAAKDLSIGAQQLSSIKVFAKTRVRLFSDDNFQNELLDLGGDLKDMGANNDKVSSVIVEKE